MPIIVARFVGDALTYLLNLLLTPLYWLIDSLLQLFATSGQLRDFLSVHWVNNLILGGQVIASSILVLRFTLAAFQLATERAEGAPTDPGALFKRTFKTAAAIFIGPHIYRQGIIFGNLLANWVASTGLGYQFESLSWSALTESVNMIGSLPFLLLVGAVLMLVIFLQALVRTVEVTLAAIIYPFASLGHMSGGGTAEASFREFVILILSHAVQMLLVYTALAFLFTPQDFGVGSALMSPILRTLYFLSALWVSLRTPRILRNYAYSTGMSSAVGTVGNQAVGQLVRNMMRKF